MPKSKGRRAGGHNRGYFYRKGRGWYTGVGQVALRFEDGRKIKDPKTPEPELRAAYARWLLDREKHAPAAAHQPSLIRVSEVMRAYLDHAQHTGAEQTFMCRADTLFDFCYGLPGSFRHQKRQPTKADRIHAGYGNMLVTEIIPLHIDQWLQAHPTWNGGIKSKVQAVKRAFNYATEAGLIAANPIKGYKTPKARARVSYITDEQEAAILKHAFPRLATALRILVRTGARPGVEFAHLEARHVRDHGDKMEWVFPAEETKTGRLRVIRITDSAVMEDVRRQVTRYPEGKLFRNSRHGPWEVKTMSRAFVRAMTKAKRNGAKFDPDTCLYSTRHTYAKRTLQGYWTGRATNVETLARLMGNSVQTCRDYYLQWTETYNEPLWEAC